MNAVNDLDTPTGQREYKAFATWAAQYAIWGYGLIKADPAIDGQAPYYAMRWGAMVRPLPCGLAGCVTTTAMSCVAARWSSAGTATSGVPKNAMRIAVRRAASDPRRAHLEIGLADTAHRFSG